MQKFRDESMLAIEIQGMRPVSKCVWQKEGSEIDETK